MTTFDYNEELIKAMKGKLPGGVNLANTLIDMLYLGKEAVYRRLRGEVPFTLAEAATISQKMGVSLDKLVGSNKGMNAIFDLNIIHYSEPLETYYSIVDNYVKIFQEIKGDPTSVLCTASNIIPQTFYLKYELLSKFRMFKWLYQFEKIDIEHHFEELQMVDKLLDRQRDFVRESQEFNRTVYIWDSKIFVYLVNDIKYFARTNLISQEYVQKLKKELIQLLDELEEIAVQGVFKTGKEVSIYIANVNFEATYSYIATSAYRLSLIRLFAINSITSHDENVFRNVKEWVDSLRKYSVLISQSGEIQRIKFFNEQREIINGLCE
ncbi:helix-turn-helix domain-containing protein [Butyricimonas synergistica]|uniref:helix-turn-helix domain-containing protein n=1 Tax=Butyricimonas synergistica TaxID=544644 RepID=UPI0003825F27|nr:helix-turn-helix domain-containing protein [Butyricimonas synergistica]